MASKENLYNIGRIILAGSALGAAACSLEQKSPSQGSEARGWRLEVGGQMLTEEEIAQMRNYEGFIAALSKTEPTTTLVITAAPEATAIPESKPQMVEKLPVAQMTAEGAGLIDKYKAELPGILIKIGADSQQVEDLTMYYPIYRAAQDRFGVPWDLIWIIHQEESNVSRNEAAYDCNIHCGPMQRAVEFHPQEDIDRANVSVEYLQALAVRHFGDASEIVWAAASIDEWAGQDRDYQKALFRYSAKGPAQGRFRKFLEIEALLGQ